MRAEVTLTGLDVAVARGLDYLHQHQYPNGEFCAYIANDAPMQSWCVPESSVFPTALIAGSLLFLAKAPLADEMLNRATRFFQEQKSGHGLWCHFTLRHPLRHLCPPDVDDTACISAILRARGIGTQLSGDASLLLSNRNRAGLFYTWFAFRWNSPRASWWVTWPELRHPLQSLIYWSKVEASRWDVDGVVNANALFYLGDRPETRAVIDFLLRIIAEGKESDCDLWYRDPHMVYYFFSRCFFQGITRLEPARQPVIDRIRAAAKPDGRLGETLVDTALGVCTLLNWRATPPELAPAIHFLLKAQQGTGEWPRWLVYYGGPKKRLGFGSEEMTTAFCIEALARYRGLGGPEGRKG